MSAALLQLACWTYLPDFATRQVLSVIHRFSEKAFNLPCPPPRSPGYIRHYRYTYAAVVLCYLTYNFIDAWSGLPTNFYELLGVSSGSDEGTLRAAFRAFAKKNHPDRIGPEGEALFIQARDAFEALKDPVVRFAYDRFGPDVLRWQGCVTTKDYLRRGLVSSMPRHVMTGAALFLISVVGKQSPVAAWRYLLFVGTFALELYLIVAPSPAGSGTPATTFVDQARPGWTPFEGVFPQRVAYQHVLLLHQAFLFMSVAVSRVAPVLFSGAMAGDGEREAGVARALGARIGELSAGVERELWLGLKSEVDAIDAGDELRRGMVLGEVEEMAVEHRLRSEPGPMRSAWDRAVARGRVRARCRSL